MLEAKGISFVFLGFVFDIFQFKNPQSTIVNHFPLH
ncbi:MAG: hypothetical protein ACI9KI_002073, partial [Patiriisocius sp.]